MSGARCRRGPALRARAHVWACALALITLGCGDDAADGRGTRGPDAGQSAAGGKGAGADAAAGSGAGGDAVRDGGDGAKPDASAPDAGPEPCTFSDAGEPGAPRLSLELPAQPRPGTPFVVAIDAESSWSGDAQLCVQARLVARARLYRGRGSASLTIDEPGPARLSVRAGGAVLAHTVEVRARPVRALSGTLGGDELSWSAAMDVQLTGDVRVPAGALLAIAPGTRVLLGENAALEVEGELQVRGTREDPVVFARAGQAAWGGIRLLPGSSAALAHTWLGGGGGDASRAFGHSSSQPVLWADNASVTMDGGGIVDNPGKALGSATARLNLQRVLISRCDSGGQLNESALELLDSHVLEIPDADGRFDDDDNDGIYLLNPMSDAQGMPVASRIADSVFAIGEDDAIDHNDAELRVERVWIEGFRHEGLAASNGHRVVISDSVVRGCEQGIEAGYGAPTVEVEHCLVTDNDVGLRLGDSYDWDTSGSMTVRHTISHANRSNNALNFVKQISGPLPGALTITCSLVNEPDYDTMTGNMTGEPSGDLSTGCAEGPRAEEGECDGEVLGPRCR